MNRFVAYYRVSTNKQKQSSLGLKAQKDVVTNHIKLTNGVLVDEFEDTESGKSEARPGLMNAIRQCELSNATLLIAKLDRLSRNVAFLSRLMESGIEFTCCDNPQATRLTIHILAAVAEEERRMISNRTKQALAQAKKDGVKLGTNNLPEASEITALRARQAHILKSTQYKEKVKQQLVGCSETSLRGKAAYLNELGVTTRRGKRWTATAVSRLLNN